MKAADILKKKGADKKSDGKTGNKLIDWIGKRRGKSGKDKYEEKGDE